MSKSLATLKEDAQRIKNETGKAANTATRVGGLFEDIVDKIGDGLEDKSITKRKLGDDVWEEIESLIEGEGPTPDQPEDIPEDAGTVSMLEWWMLDNEGRNNKNETVYHQQRASSKGMLSLKGIDKVYFQQTATSEEITEAVQRNYVLEVSFIWFSERGGYVSTDDYVRLDQATGYWQIPSGATNGYVVFVLNIATHEASIFKELIESAKIYTNLLGKNRVQYNLNSPTNYEADNEKYKSSIHRGDLVVRNFGYSQWWITDSGTGLSNDIWRPRDTNYMETIFDLGEYSGYNAVAVTARSDIKCWFTFLKSIPSRGGQTVQQSSVYGTSKYVHHYVQVNETLIRLIPDDAKYLVVSYKHGDGIRQTYTRPAEVRFFNSNISSGTLSEEKIKNDEFTRTFYPLLTSVIGRSTNRLNEIKLCHWNIGHYSLGQQPYSAIEDIYEDSMKTAYTEFMRKLSPQLLFLSEYSEKFSKSYNSAPTIFDYRCNYIGRIDRYCCQAMFSNTYIQLLDVVYFPYETYLVSNSYTDANDYVTLYRTYINNHSITIAHVHLRSGDETINTRQCEYLIERLSGYWHVLIVGDFNRTDMSIFENAGFTVKITGTTHMGTAKSLDHFVYRGSVAIQEERIVETYLSDHFAIVATLTTTDNKRMIGVTEDRPTSVEVGFQFFDKALLPPRPVYWTGTDWRDGAGVRTEWELIGIADFSKALYEETLTPAVFDDSTEPEVVESIPANPTNGMVICFDGLISASGAVSEVSVLPENPTEGDVIAPTADITVGTTPDDVTYESGKYYIYQSGDWTEYNGTVLDGSKAWKWNSANSQWVEKIKADIYKDTYTSSSAQWTNAQEGVIYSETYDIEGLTLEPGDIVRFVLRPLSDIDSHVINFDHFIKTYNFEFSAYYINKVGNTITSATNGTILSSSGKNTFGLVEKTVKVPSGAGSHTHLRLRITCDELWPEVRMVVGKAVIS